MADICTLKQSYIGSRRLRDPLFAAVLSLGLLMMAGTSSVALAQDAPLVIYPRTGQDFSGVLWAVDFGGGAPRPPVQESASAQPGSAASAASGSTSPASRQPPEVENLSRSRFPPQLVDALQPWAYEALQNYLRVSASGEEPMTANSSCYPNGVPSEHSAMGVVPFQFLMTPEVTVLLMEFNRHARVIHMNRQHPKDLKPSWVGHSVGRWDGDTLVIDTIGYNDLSQIATGVLHSSALHTVERYRLVDGGRKLEAHFSFEDPGSLTRPVEIVRTFAPSANQQILQEYICHENNDRPVPLATAKTESQG